MQFMFMQQSCEETCSFIPCSFLALSLFIPRSSLTCERPILSQITQIIADKTQTTPKHHKHQPVFLCEIMQLAAFPLRNLRNLRENIHARGLKLLTQMKTPEVSRRSRRLRRQNHKTQNHNNSINLTNLSFSA